MKLIQRKSCGCKVYHGAGGIPVENLCKRHMSQVITEANKTLAKRGQPLIGEVRQ